MCNTLCIVCGTVYGLWYCLRQGVHLYTSGRTSKSPLVKQKSVHQKSLFWDLYYMKVSYLGFQKLEAIVP